MMLEKVRSTLFYKICGRIGIFALPLALIIAKWCKVVGGTAYGPALVGFFTLIPFLLICTIVFLILTMLAIGSSREDKPLPIKTNIVADIGYIMYIILSLTGLFIYGSL